MPETYTAPTASRTSLSGVVSTLMEKLLAEKKELVFRKNPFEQNLDTHKLHGRLKDFWSFSIGFKYRIIFEFADQNIIYFHSVGDHDIYQ